MVDAGEEAVGETAGESLFEVVFLRGGDLEGLAGGGGVDGGAVRLGGGGDIMRAFEAAFDFEGGDAECG